LRECSGESGSARHATWEGFEGSPCNTVDETVVFTFDTGTITTHAVHRVPAVRLRTRVVADA
jgi:hypothetical protein